jgi:hypothetical protein
MATAAPEKFADPWADRRGEERVEGLVDSALLHFRGKPYRVPVINIRWNREGRIGLNFGHELVLAG